MQTPSLSHNRIAHVHLAMCPLVSILGIILSAIRCITISVYEGIQRLFGCFVEYTLYKPKQRCLLYNITIYSVYAAIY